MTTRFDRALAIILKWEGGISDHKDDPGGFTVKGITLGFLRAVGLDPNNDGVIDKRDLIGLTDTKIAEIYRDQIWRPCLCHIMPGGMALMVFDAGTNLGQPRAHRLLQEALGVTVDGVLGPVTLKALRDAEIGPLLAEYAARRGFYYATRPKVLIFGLGWFRRLVSVYRQSVGV